MKYREKSDSPAIRIVCGHYGSGKTNVAVNLALAEKKHFPEKEVALADLDIVNPYFRSADAAEMLRRASVLPLVPPLANSNVDIPSMPPILTSYFGAAEEARDPDFPGKTAYLDVGGDDGAVVLGMYAGQIAASGYEMLYVISMYRPLTADPADAAELMREIESLSRLRCTGIINNSSIGEETTAADVVDSVPWARECAAKCGLPLLCHAYRADLLPDLPRAFAEAGFGGEALLPMENATKRLF